MAKDYDRYTECVRRARKCDCRGPANAEWERLELEEDRLERQLKESEDKVDSLALEESEARKNIESISSKLREQYARISRLRKQQKSLKDRRGDILRRGAGSLNELEVVDGLEDELPVNNPSITSPSEDLFRELSPGFWESLGPLEESLSGVFNNGILPDLPPFVAVGNNSSEND